MKQAGGGLFYFIFVFLLFFAFLGARSDGIAGRTMWAGWVGLYGVFVMVVVVVALVVVVVVVIVASCWVTSSAYALLQVSIRLQCAPSTKIWGRSKAAPFFRLVYNGLCRLQAWR